GRRGRRRRGRGWSLGVLLLRWCGGAGRRPTVQGRLDLLAQQAAQGLGVPGGRVLELLEQVAQLSPHEVARGDVVQGEAQRGDLPGDEVGGGVVAVVGLAILLGLHAVAVVLPVLREQQQRRGVGGLQREDQREQG